MHGGSGISLGIIEQSELVEARHRPLDVVVVEALPAQLLHQLGAEVIAPSDQLQSLVVRGIIQF